MDDALERFARFKEFGSLAAVCAGAVRGELLGISAATIDRYLAPERAKRYPAEFLSSTRPGTEVGQEPGAIREHPYLRQGEGPTWFQYMGTYGEISREPRT